MKKFYITGLFQIISFVLIAQEACPDFCSYDLSDPVPMYQDVDASNPISYAKTTSTPNYRDVKYDADVDELNQWPIPDCINDADDCFEGNEDRSALVYKVFYPVLPLQTYIDCPLPCIIVAHGGSFFECSKYDNISGFCRDLASRGFVVFNVEYRRGRKGDNQAPQGFYTSVQQMQAVYKGCQDLRGAIRSIIKRGNNQATSDDPWRIDVNNIFWRVKAQVPLPYWLLLITHKE